MQDTNAIHSAKDGPLVVGSVFAERFEVLSILGQGGTSTVYKARQIAMDRIVALKVMHVWLLADSKAYQRFQREAQAASSLNHPNIVKVHSFGVDGQHAYLVMDYFEGLSLAAVLKEKKHLSPDELLPIVIPAAKALSHAHAHGVLHRDIKPANIMIVDGDSAEPPNVQLVDFGVAKLIDDAEHTQRLTQTDGVVGTPHYMSPEQCQRGVLDARSDMYSLGCVIYTALTGEHPFDGDSAFAIMYSHIHEEAPALPSTIPAYLASTTFRLLAKNPDDRFANMDEVVAALSEKHAVPNTVPIRRTARISRRVYIIAGAVLAGCCLSVAVLACYKQAFGTKPPPKITVPPSEDVTSVKHALMQWENAISLGPVEGKRVAATALSDVIMANKRRFCSRPLIRVAQQMLGQYKSYFHATPAEVASEELEIEWLHWNIMDPSERTADYVRKVLQPAAEAGHDPLKKLKCVEFRINLGDLKGTDLKKTLLEVDPLIDRVVPHSVVEEAEISQALCAIYNAWLPMDSKKAFAICEKALKISAAFSGENSRGYANTLFGKGLLLKNNQRYDEAESAYLRAIDIMLAASPGRQEMASACDCYGQLHDIIIIRHDVARAARVIGTAAKLWDTVVAKEPPGTDSVYLRGASLYLLLALDYSFLKENTKSLDALAHANNYLKRMRPELCNLAPQAAFQEGNLLLEKGDLAEAQKAFTRGITWENNYHFGSEYSAWCYARNGHISEVQQRWEDALRDWEDGRRMMEELGQKNAIYIPTLKTFDEHIAVIKGKLKEKAKHAT